MKPLFLSMLLIPLFVQAEPAPDGTLDPLFGINGQVVLDLGANTDFFGDVAVQADNKIVAVGRVQVDVTTAHQALARFNTDGTLDMSFGNQGIVINTNFLLPITISQSQFSGCAIQQNGSILVGAYGSVGDIIVARYLTNGDIDTSFGAGNGFIVIDLGIAETGSVIAVQEDGKIIVIGNTSVNGRIVRLNPNGALDTSFGANGIVAPAFTGINVAFTDIKIQYDGKLIVGGYIANPAPERFVVARFYPDGSFDTSFGTNHGYTITTIQNSARALSLAVQADGKAVLSGESAGSIAVARYVSSGFIDNSFGTNGIAVVQTGTSNQSLDVVIQADGKIVVVGAGTVSGADQCMVVRFLSDGSLDQSFGANGFVVNRILGNSVNSLRGVALDSFGNIVAAGVTGAALFDAGVVRYRVDSLKTSNVSQTAWQRYYNQNIVPAK